MTVDLFTHARKAAPPDVILLDYQCTLVANGDGRRGWFARYGRSRPFTDWIAREVYREWLLPLFGDRTVILITARQQQWRAATMARLRTVLDWQPHEVYFNPARTAPPALKRTVLMEHIYPRYGTPAAARYLALESNALTRDMYARQGIVAVKVPETGRWTELPRIMET